MKILFFFGTMSRGGAERMLSCLANTYIKKNEEVVIVTLDDSDSKYELHDKVRHVKLCVSKQTNGFWEKVKRNILEWKKVMQCIKEEKPNVVLSFSKRTAAQLLFIRSLVRGKYKIVASERANPKYDKISRLEQGVIQWSLNRIDGFIFQTNRVKQYFSVRLQEKGCVIPNGVFDELLPKEITNYETRRNYEFCAVGRLAEQKGYDVLLNAFAIFVEKYPDYRLNIFGEGPLRERLEHEIRRLGIQGKVILHGNVPDVINQIKDYGMYIMASRFEGMPNALLEAMACGLPCISTDCEFGPGEIIVNGENGLLVPIEDTEALAKAIEQIVTDKELAQKVSLNAVRVRDDYNGKKVAEMYYEYIKGLL